MKNKYLSRSKISEKKYRQILRLFCDDLTAVQIAQSTGLGQQSRQPAFNESQAADRGHCEASSPLCGEVEIDESYFGPRRVRGKKGRGAGKKIIVFGVLKRRSKVDTQNASRAALKQVIEARTQPFIPRAGGLTTASSIGGYQKHYRVNHSAHEFAQGRKHINGIESFWGVAKIRLAAKRGLRPEYFNLHLKECEFRYNMRRKDMYLELLKILREGA